MSNNASVETGPTLTPEEEADRRRETSATLADQADAEVAVIKEKLDGVKAALKEKKAEAKRLRAEAKEAGA